MKTIFYASTSSLLGSLWAAASAEGLWALEYGLSEPDFHAACRKRGSVELYHDPEKVTPYLEQICEYLNGQRTTFDLPIDWSGMTDFQRRVRQAVMAIPAGQTASYGEIAAQVGRPAAARAVGQVNATNPLILVVPCHRVVASDGSLTGYGGIGGLQAKHWLLALENGRNTQQTFIPV
jgi:O-6-methylguanine DNA methyltransferase